MGRTVDLKNQKVWDFLKKGKNLKGIFQLETHSASKVLQTIAPNNIEELAIVNSANRPGAMAFVEEIADVKHGRKEAQYLHPSLKKYFEPTFSKWVYQEQILLIAKELAGFSASESSNLMKSLGKKDSDKMQKLKEAFIEGMIKNKYSKEVAEELFKEMKEFANYGFNKSHAVGYSLLGYFNAEIKIENTLEFFTSLFNNLKPTDPFGELFEVSTELSDFNLKLLSPSIDKISDKFQIEDGNIRYPLGLIKGLGNELYKKLATLNSSQLATIDSCLEALINVELNSKAIESIIICGALDKFDVPREDILLYYWFLSSLQNEVLEKFWLFKNGYPLSTELILKFLEFREEKLVGKSKKLKWASYFKTEATREKRLQAFKEDVQIILSYKENIKAAYYIWEMSVLGYSNNYKFSDKLNTYQELDALDIDDVGMSFAAVEDVDHRKSQKGNGYGIYHLKFDRRQTFMFFGQNYDLAKDFVRKGDFVTITAKKTLKGLNISSIKAINNEVRKYEFYKKQKEPNQTE